MAHAHTHTHTHIQRPEHMSFQQPSPCQNASEQNSFSWLETAIAAAVNVQVVRQQVFWGKWQLACQMLMLKHLCLYVTTITCWAFISALAYKGPGLWNCLLKAVGKTRRVCNAFIHIATIPLPVNYQRFYFCLYHPIFSWQKHLLLKRKFSINYLEQN